jgi:hypothetical protein
MDYNRKVKVKLTLSHGEVEIKHKAVCIFSHSTIQGDIGEKVTIVGGNNISHCKKE